MSDEHDWIILFTGSTEDDWEKHTGTYESALDEATRDNRHNDYGRTGLFAILPMMNEKYARDISISWVKENGLESSNVLLMYPPELLEAMAWWLRNVGNV